jgi:hypothetical protein
MNETLANATVVFALVVALALLVERLLEVVKCGYDLLDSRLDWYRFWSRRGERLRVTLERKLHTLRFVKPKHLAALLAKFDDQFADGPVQNGRVPVIAGDLVRGAAIKIAAKVVGVAAGVTLAFWLRINLVTYWVETGAPAPSATWLQVALTGTAIGLGSGPVHKVIRAVENRQKRTAQGGRG